MGLLNLDGAPADRALLERMTQFLAFRGPDAQNVWCQAQAGLGHALLRVTREAATERQPGSLDNRLYIVADARIDARAELIEKLKTKCKAPDSLSLCTPDSDLILHAYDSWGQGCVEHLLGDFSFAIWNAQERHLFCARDHLGVKPFYYARLGSQFIFSNTLDCVRMHPAISRQLNDLAIADFLLFDMNRDLSTTAFTDIQRLPPAHVLVCEQGAASTRRYWELCVTTPIRFSRDEECIERFRELLDAAVADRLRADEVSVLMSGGLDSTIVAASARTNVATQGRPANLCAYTQVFDDFIPYEERHYATLAADMLAIPIEFLVTNHVKIFGRADRPEYCTPEPTHQAWPDATSDQLRQVAARSRVALTGYGGDPALCGRITVHFRKLLKARQFATAIADAARYLGAERRISRLYISTRWRILLNSKQERSSYPPWLDERLERELGLRERWESVTTANSPEFCPAVRPESYELITDPAWPLLFESQDAGVTKTPVEVRHPIFDLRLLEFLLALPRLPWCSDKELFRAAGRGVLPDEVRLRRKSPSPVDPVVTLLSKSGAAWVDEFIPTPALESYIVRNRVPAVSREKDPWRAWVNLRPLSLNFWLRSSG